MRKRDKLFKNIKLEKKYFSSFFKITTFLCPKFTFCKNLL